MNCNCQNENRKEEMLQKIREINFMIIELGLYLDTHPEDEKAIDMHNDYAKKYREITDQYQKVYGPLTIDYPCDKWKWQELPWPWQKGAN